MTDWLDELKLEPGPPFSTMGTHALDLDRWLVVDGDRDADLARKAELLENDLPVVFSAEPDSAAAAEELLALIRGWLGDHGIIAPARHGDEHPLIDAARLVQEDLAVLQRIGGAWVLTSGVVCFPTHWRIADKIGLPLAGIHAPVAHYERELRGRIDLFHERLTPQRPVWRRNWFVSPTAELHLPAHGSALAVAARIEVDGSPMWIRSERQTLRRLAETDAIVFTIRVQRAPLGVLLERPDIAAKMLAATRSWDHDKRMYTSTGVALDELIDWLGTVVGPDADSGRPPRTVEP